MSNYNNATKKITDEITATLTNIKSDDVDQLLTEINKADKVFFVGVGRVLLSLKAIAKRLAHIGIKTYVVGQITEPAITDKDLLIVGSGSGETQFPLIIANKAKQFNARVAHIGTNPNSSMSQYSDLFIRIPISSNAATPEEVQSEQPMKSLFEQSLLLLGDTIALMMVNEKNIELQSLWEYHANLE
ncbi:3-hexulose-6-phosphate isomerase [Halobacillus andaensis]|uniref:3-hexulose-6-phosphate isomerase n=1 Tax=Halobacillus andaensis TaxID=1176239 RepID=A0A917EZ85_HALAA|nr:6-phospho-3-hexuloisomerase [Halobacillus andaensis]MBP2006514.1 6-phospho-3-hexuloisomerase [Halobacillus andaensis]GGF27980.1 3-hexulose-6-phosphate isomerase [Halobacillus andaensis]